MDELFGDGVIVEGGEGGDERGEEEVRVEGEDGVKERREGEGTREVRESVGDMDGWGVRVRDEVGETYEAD